eukprot:336868_1
MYQSKINCPTKGNCAFDITGNDAIYQSIITGPYKGSLSMILNGTAVLDQSFIIGPINGDLNIRGFGEELIDDSRINCPQIGDCNINLTGTYAIDEALINCPEIGDCNINLIGEEALYEAVIHCPQCGDCNINVTGDDGMVSETKIYGGTSENLNVYCNGYQCMDGIYLHCPTGNCKVTVNGEQSIHETKIYGQAASLLIIEQEGNDVFYESNILCPLTMSDVSNDCQSNCVIRKVGDESDTSDIYMYAANIIVNQLDQLKFEYKNSETSEFIVQNKTFVQKYSDGSSACELDQESNDLTCSSYEMNKIASHYSNCPSTKTNSDCSEKHSKNSDCLGKPSKSTVDKVKKNRKL